MTLLDHFETAPFRKNKNQMYRQLLLYSKYCADEYGTFPDTLRFNLFKEGTYDERPFDQKEYVAARQWAESVIENMKSKDITDWSETRPELFRCTNLCNCRMECPFGRPENHKRKENEYGKRVPVAA